MQRALSFSLCVMILASAGCDSSSGSSGSNGSDPGDDMTIRQVRDSGSMMDATQSPPLDAEPVGDLGADDSGPAFTDAGVLALETCADICGLYESCDRLDIWPMRRISNCLEACEDVIDTEPFARYRLCLQTTPCEDLNTCRMPPKPRASCEDVCSVMAECGGTERVPQGLPNVASCENACDIPSLSADIRTCGQSFVDDPQTCNEEEFATCILTEQSPSCVGLCEKQVSCGDAEDLIDCTLECINTPEAEDPVTQRRRRILFNCAEATLTCEEFEGCQGQSTELVSDEDIMALCQADAECGFFGPECPERAGALLRVSDGNTQVCAADRLVNACDEGFLSCLSPRIPNVAACDEFCAVAALCDELPPNLLELECAADCREAIDSGSNVRIAQYSAGVRCAYANSCADFAGCLEVGDETVSCDDFCRRTALCGEDENACLNECAERSGTIRHWAERTCSVAASECNGVQTCQPPEPPPCGTLCALVDDCPNAPLDCVQRCDDRDYVGDGSFLTRYACLVSGDDCDEREICESGDFAAGYACLNWCRHEQECADNEGDMVQCLTQCGAGFQGRDGLSFSAAEECFAREGPDADCMELTECLQAGQPASLCETFCSEQSRCQLTIDDEACEATCLDALAQDDFESIQCVLSAILDDAQCGVIAECVGYEAPAASDDCSALCAERANCDPAFDVFLCERECTPDPDGIALRRACAERAECEQIPLCVASQGQVPAVCSVACETVGECDGLLGPDADALYVDQSACEIDCAINHILTQGSLGETLPECLDAAMCVADDVSGCFEGRSPVDCAAGWAAIVACNNQGLFALAMINNEADYVRICEEQNAINPAQVEQELQCLQDTAANAMGDPIACIQQLICVAGAIGP